MTGLSITSPNAPRWATAQKDIGGGDAYWSYVSPIQVRTLGDNTAPVTIALERFDELDDDGAVIEPGECLIHFPSDPPKTTSRSTSSTG